MFAETKIDSGGPSPEQQNLAGEVTAEQSFDEAVADVFPTFAKTEAAVLITYAAWLGFSRRGTALSGLS